MNAVFSPRSKCSVFYKSHNQITNKHNLGTALCKIEMAKTDTKTRHTISYMLYYMILISKEMNCVTIYN